MQKDDLDKTQLMQPVERERKPLQDMEDTSSFPAITEEDIKRQGVRHGVRELGRISMPQDKKRSFFTKKRKQGIILVAVFLLALFCGVAFAGYAKESSELAEGQKTVAQQKDLDMQERRLEEKRQKLEKERQKLEAQKKEKRSAREKQEDSSDFVDEILDKVKGKEKTAPAAKEGDSIDAAISEAQSGLDDVNEKLQAVAEMKKKADKVKSTADQVYRENKGTIDTILHYAAEGVDIVRNHASGE